VKNARLDVGGFPSVVRSDKISGIREFFDLGRCSVAPAIRWIVLALVLLASAGCSIAPHEVQQDIVERIALLAGKPEEFVEEFPELRPPPDDALRQTAKRQFAERLQEVEFDHSRGLAVIRISLGEMLEGRAVRSVFANYKLFAPSAFSIPEIDLLEFQALTLMTDDGGSTAERMIVFSMTRQTADTIDWRKLDAGQFELSMERQGDGISIDPLLWSAWVGLQHR
jgi:hypothetical protein